MKKTVCILLLLCLLLVSCRESLPEADTETETAKDSTVDEYQW